jgi:hypothetical protein
MAWQMSGKSGKHFWREISLSLLFLLFFNPWVLVNFLYLIKIKKEVSLLNLPHHLLIPCHT